MKINDEHRAVLHPHLNLSDDIYRQLVEHASAAAFCVDTREADRLSLLHVNQAWCALMRCQMPPAGSALNELSDTALGETLTVQVRECLSAGTGVQLSSRTTVQGKAQILQTSLTPLRESGGEIVCIYGVVHDISEQQLRQERFELLDFALQQVHEAAFLVDKNARLHYVNAEACRALGYSQAELMAMSVPDLDPDWSMEQWPAFWQSLTTAGSLTFESRNRRKDGTIFPVEIFAIAMKYQGEDYEFALVRNITDWKESEALLNAQAESYRALVENLPDVVARFDVDARYLYVTPKISRLFGVTSADLLGTTPQGMDTDGRPLVDLVKLAIETETPNKCETLWETNEGLRRFAVTHVPEFDESARVISVLRIASDITAKEEAEKQFRILAENLPDVVIRYDLDCRRTYVNQAYHHFTGNRIEDAIGKRPEELWSPITPVEEFVAVLERVMSTGRQDDIMLQLRTSQGQMLHHAVSVVAEKNVTGRVVGALSISRDVTAFMTVQEALKESEERYRQIFENTQESLFLLEVLSQGRFRFLQVNPAFERTLGHSHSTLIGKHVDEIMAPDIAAFLNDRYQRCQQTAEITQDEVELDVGRGRRTYHITLIPIRDQAHRIHRISGMARDITERKESELAMKRLNRALKTLSSGNEVLIRASSEENLLREMCRVVVDVGGYQLAWIGFKTTDDSLDPLASAGDTTVFNSIEAYHRQGKHMEDPASIAAHTDKVQVLHDIDLLPECAFFRDQLKRSAIQACLALPLIHAGQHIGVLNIYSTDNSAFDQDEVRLLKEMADDLSYGIHSLRVRNDRERFVQRLQDNMEATIQALASTVELRDPYTAGHQHRVAELATAVAHEMGWSEEQVQVTYLAGLVHDIGKIAIPAEILSKPGRLSDAEFMLVRTHADACYDILKAVDFPWPIAQIVRQHHERLDGSGYPQGLKGDEILPEARVLAVCDVVEAMTTHRPYRPGLGIDAALEEIERGKGDLFDVKVVETCIQVIREQGFKFE